MALRDPLDTTERQIKKLIKAHEKNTQSVATTKDRQAIEKLVREKVMPQTVYEKGKR